MADNSTCTNLDGKRFLWLWWLVLASVVASTSLRSTRKCLAWAVGMGTFVFTFASFMFAVEGQRNKASSEEQQLIGSIFAYLFGVVFGIICYRADELGTKARQPSAVSEINNQNADIETAAVVLTPPTSYASQLTKFEACIANHRLAGAMDESTVAVDVSSHRRYARPSAMELA